MQVCQSKQQSAHILPSNAPDSHQLVCQEPAVLSQIVKPYTFALLLKTPPGCFAIYVYFLQVFEKYSEERPIQTEAEGSNFLPLHVDIRFSQPHFSKDYPFFNVSFGELSQKPGGCRSVSLYLELFCAIDLPV